MMWNKMEIFKITERREEAVFKTKQVGYVWLSPYCEDYTGYGDYMFVNTSEKPVFQLETPPQYQ